jgi:spermidine/putrescine transport system substrate-binding protein
VEDGPNLNRRGFFTATGGISIAALLAACGGSDSGSDDTGAAASTQAAAPAASTDAAPAAATPPKYDPTTETGPVKTFEWAGYEVPEMWEGYVKGPFNADSPMKFTFLENDQQALAKVASGVQYDLIHPCIAYWPDYKAAGLIQAFDPSLLPDYEGIPETIRKPGTDTDGLIYHVPFDIGFSALTYRADKVNPAELSWNVLLDAQYKGRMALFSDEVAIIKIGHLINAGAAVDPNVMTTEEIQAAAETMKKVAPNLRNFWASQTDTVNDFVNGNIDMTYTWPDGYWKIKNHEKMKGVPIEYMWPKEGRLAWVCGLVLGAGSKVPGRATSAVAAANSPTVGAWLTDVYQYGSAQQSGVTDLIKDKALLTAFSLNDPTAFAPPRAWFEAPLPNRAEYVKAGQDVKASVGAS